MCECPWPRGAPIAALLLGVSTFGCGSEPPEEIEVDAGARLDAGPVAAPMPPDIPWLAAGAPPIAQPALTPCPDGWREVPGELAEDPIYCDPYPEGGRLDCPDGEAHFPGEPGCAPVGAPCPAGEFAADLPADRSIVYIRPGAVMGDGSLARPFGTVAEAGLDTFAMDGVIALGVGAHEGPVRLARGHDLMGACAARTVLGTSVPHMLDGVVTFTGTGAEARDLTVADSERAGVVVAGGGVDGRLEGVVLSRVRFLAIVTALGARLVAETLLVRDTASTSATARFGRGIDVTQSTADVRRVVLSGNRDVGMFVAGTGTEVHLADLVVADTEEQPSDGDGGRGLSVQDGAMATASRALFARNRGVGVYGSGDGTMAMLTDVVVRGTRSRMNDGEGGRGLSVLRGARANATRTALLRNHEVGAAASRAGTFVSLSDALVHGTRGRSNDGRFGRGLNIQHGAGMDVVRVVLSDNRDAGAHASQVDTSLTMSDVVVRDTGAEASDQSGGRGLAVQLGAMATMDRTIVARSRDFGLFTAGAGTLLTVSDLAVRDTEGQASDGLFGRGLQIQDGALIDVARALVTGNRALGVAAMNGADAFLDDVVIERTRPRGCVDTICVDDGGGHGAGSYDRATSLRMRNFVVRESELCGLQIANDGELDLTDGEVSGNPIGACLQIDGYDAERLTTGVRYADNGVNLQATTLPVPDAGPVAVDP